MMKNLRQMNEVRNKLNATVKGDAVEYKLIDFSFQGVMLTKTLIEMYGNERASQMLSNAQRECAPVMNKPMVEYLEKEVPQHLRYAVVNGLNKSVMNKSVNDEGLFELDWIDDDIFSAQFEFHVKRCVFRDIGKEFGDTVE
eukprot:CAMPEP_0197069506 /NCGR_PEP_ID=MMETSP1384-20130603/193641_1 /TAXON_ID=29189 /ORGANISM="Ammonia sp." /LENGTH=140 /DNA_ID=CAMNT_0042507587 /DNA_START=37 /DNA_END=456 /DNA_ORIENTATION=-